MELADLVDPEVDVYYVQNFDLVNLGALDGTWSQCPQRGEAFIPSIHTGLETPPGRE